MPEEKVSEFQQEARTGKYRLPGTGKMVSFTTYRAVTGKCEKCDAPMDDHPECDACGALCGSGHLDGLPSPYRGHQLCGHCLVLWKRLDRVIGRQTLWGEFLIPPIKIFPWRKRKLK